MSSRGNTGGNSRTRASGGATIQEQVTRAEERVRAARELAAQIGREAEANAALGAHGINTGSHDEVTSANRALTGISRRQYAAQKALNSAETRLATLQKAAQSGAKTPQEAARAKAAAYHEARIAKLRDQLAAAEAAYAAYKANPTAPAPARASSTRATKPNPVGASEFARIDSRLALMRDSSDPQEAWRTYGGSRAKLYDALKEEPLGTLEVMARRAAPDGARPPRTVKSSAYANAISRDRLAQFIADQMAAAHGQQPAAATPKATGARTSGGAKPTSASKGYETWRAEADRLLSLSRTSQQAGSVSAALAVHMGQHKAYTARWRKELQARGEYGYEQGIAAVQRARGGQ